jgi:hypothetical protein
MNIAYAFRAGERKLPRERINCLPTNVLRRADPLDILCLQPFVAGHNIEGDFFPFIQGLKSATRNRGMMHENILPRALGDESKPFFIVEPFYFAACHIAAAPDLRGWARMKKDMTEFQLCQ